jgi:hypothetical protein
VVSHAADSVYALMNRLLGAGRTGGGRPRPYTGREEGGAGRRTGVSDELYWLAAPVEGAARGDLWIPPAAASAEELSRLASELHVPVRPLPAAPAVPRHAVRAARVGLYKPWVASIDEGWTRWLLERYGFPMKSLANEEIRSGAFARDVDVLVFPAVDPDVLAVGHPTGETAARLWSPLPPPYAGGLDSEGPAATGSGGKGAGGSARGGERIRAWVEAGGTVVALDESARYFIDLFGLPLTDVLAEGGGGVEAPGSMLRVLVDTEHPLAYGLRPVEAAYFAESPAFQTVVPDARFDRRVVVRYPDDERDILMSGYLRGGAALEKRAAVVEVRVGKGRVVLIGFRPQHRAQTVRTFKLLFNALYRVGEAEER